MSRHRDNAPVGNTCPKIDNVISFLHSIDCENISEKEISKTVNIMEEIRDANSKLRDWGNEENRLRDEFESERDQLEKENKNLEEDIVSYKKDIQELVNRVEELEGVLSSVK